MVAVYRGCCSWLLFGLSFVLSVSVFVFLCLFEYCLFFSLFLVSIKKTKKRESEKKNKKKCLLFFRVKKKEKKSVKKKEFYFKGERKRSSKKGERKIIME